MPRDNINLEKYKNTDVPEFLSFDAMGLKEDLLKAIPFEKPSRVQSKAIVQILESGKDVLAQAQVATGKSMAAAICSLQLVDPSIKQCQVLVLLPTVDSALQFAQVVQNINKHLGVTAHACVRENLAHAIKNVEAGIQVVIATPSRVNDLLNRKALKLDDLKLVILDAADTLDKGSMNLAADVYRRIFHPVRIVMFFTMLSTVLVNSITKFTKEPLCILVNREEMMGNVSQFYVDAEKEDWKLDCLMDLLDILDKEPTIIFCNSKQKITWLYQKLEKRYPVVYIDGGMEIGLRNRARLDFENGRKPFLLSTDTCAQVIDSSKVRIVVNYDLCLARDDFIRRSGKANKPGKRGAIITFVTRDQQRLMGDLEEYCYVKFAPLPANYRQGDILGD